MTTSATAPPRSAPRPARLLPIATPAQTRRLARELLAPRRPLVASAVAALLAVSVLGLAGPLVLGRIVDTVTAGIDTGAATLAGPVLLLLVVGIAQSPLTALGHALVAQAGEPALAALRERVLDRALQLPIDDLEQAGSGDLLSRVSGDVAVIAGAIRTVLPTIAGSAFTLAATLVGLGALDWRFALAGLCAVPVQAWTLRWYLRNSGPVYATERVAEGSRAQRLLETVSGVATIRALGTAPHHQRLIRETSQEAMSRTLATVGLLTRFFGRLNLAEFVGLATILVTGFALVTSGTASLGAATAAALFFSRLFDPINALLGSIDRAQAAGAGLTRLAGILQTLPPPPPTAPAPEPATVTVTDLRFGYRPGQEVLRGVSLSLPAGSTTAVVGASGAGKSTLAALIAGMHVPDSGTISLGNDGTPRGPADLRPHIGLVTQEVHVFAGTVREDLRLAAPGADDAQLLAALDAVHACSWLDGLPAGLDTVIGAGGHPVDTAAAQQLALARIVLADPPIVVLDEATADAGSAGARLLDAAAQRVLAGRTAVVVAHRLTQAAHADHIVVLDDGRIVESGSHTELLGARGRYAALWTATGIGA